MFFRKRGLGRSVSQFLLSCLVCGLPCSLRVLLPRGVAGGTGAWLQAEGTSQKESALAASLHPRDCPDIAAGALAFRDSRDPTQSTRGPVRSDPYSLSLGVYSVLTCPGLCTESGVPPVCWGSWGPWGPRPAWRLGEHPAWLFPPSRFS